MFTIKTRIVFIVLFFIASILTAFFLYSAATTEQYKNLRIEVIDNLVTFETEKVNVIITALERNAIFYALSGALYIELQSDELAEKMVLETLKIFEAAAGGGFWFEPYAYKKDRLRTGFFASRDAETGEVRIDDSFGEDFDYHSTSWYRRIADNVTENHQVVWTKPYTAYSDYLNFITTAGAGIFNENGELILISTVDWNIEEIIDHLAAIRPTENSFILLSVPEKDYVISSTRTKSFIGVSLTENIPWDIYADKMEYNGVVYFIFGKYMYNGWYLSVQIPENEIFSEIESQNSRFSKLLFVSSIMILLLAFMATSMLVEPIKKFTQDVSKLALGNLGTEIKTASKGELMHLAEVFNKMTKELKKSIDEKAREQVAHERLNTELGIAKSIQTSMLPNVFPPFPTRKEFDIYASMLPAKEVGGDFYDFFFVDRDNLVVVIADVSGKGVPAALFMVISKTLIKYSNPFISPKAVFEAVNNKLCESNKEDMFVTAFMGIYNIPTGRFVYVNAGHNPPLLKKRGLPFRLLEMEPCIILGFLKDKEYQESEIYLEEGDVLYLYTDGVTEAENLSKELFGEERLLVAANKYADASAQSLLDGIKHEVDKFTAGDEQADDITMLALKINSKQQPKEIGGKKKFDKTKKEIRVKAEQKNLNVIVEFVNAELENLNYSADLINEVSLVTEEIFVNIINYAYDTEPGEVALKISAKENLTITIEDTGRPFNPLLEPEPDLEIDLNERKIGGLGIYFVKKIMDKIEYSYSDGKNILLMTKTVPLAWIADD